MCINCGKQDRVVPATYRCGKRKSADSCVCARCARLACAPARVWVNGITSFLSAPSQREKSFVVWPCGVCCAIKPLHGLWQPFFFIIILLLSNWITGGNVTFFLYRIHIFKECVIDYIESECALVCVWCLLFVHSDGGDERYIKPLNGIFRRWAHSLSISIATWRGRRKREAQCERIGDIESERDGEGRGEGCTRQIDWRER